MKISLSPTIKQYWIDSDSYYSIQSFEKFIKYFFDDIYLTFSEMSDDPTTDGIIYDIQHNSETPQNKCNIMLCVENCNFWNHYAHHNKYKNYLYSLSLHFFHTFISFGLALSGADIQVKIHTK